MKGYTMFMFRRTEEGTDRFGMANSRNEIVAELDVSYGDHYWGITSIYVREDERRKGIATELLQSVLEPVAGSGAFIPVEMCFGQEAADAGLLGFFASQQNFTIQEDKAFYRISSKQRKNNAEWKRIKEKESNAVEFFSLDNRIRRAFLERISEDGFDGFVSDDDSVYDRHLCFAEVKDGRVVGAVFVTAHDKNELEISFIYTDGNRPKTVISVISAAMEAADELYPNAEIWFSAVTPESAGLADGLFGDDCEAESIYTARWNGWSRADYEDMERMIETL